MRNAPRLTDFQYKKVEHRHFCRCFVNFIKDKSTKTFVKLQMFFEIRH